MHFRELETISSLFSGNKNLQLLKMRTRWMEKVHMVLKDLQGCKKSAKYKFLRFFKENYEKRLGSFLRKRVKLRLQSLYGDTAAGTDTLFINLGKMKD